MELGSLFWSVTAFWIVSEIALARMCKADAAHRRSDPSLAILWSTICCSITAGVLIGTSEAGHIAELARIYSVAGIILIIAGLCVRWIAIYTLGKMFTVDVAIVDGHELVAHGLYKYIRHPSYTGSLTSFLGLGFAFANYFSIVVIFIPICCAFLYRIHIEEKVLGTKFGIEYRRYQSISKRLVPLIY